MRNRFLLFLTLAVLVFVGASPTVRGQCMPNSNLPAGYVAFASISYVTSPDSAGDSFVIGTLTSTPAALYSGVPLPNSANQQFCNTVSMVPSAMYFAYVPTAAERGGNFTAYAPLPGNFPAFAGVPPGMIPPTSTIWAWRVPAGESVFVSTQYGGQILKVDGNAGNFTVVSGAPSFTEGAFSPEGMAVGPDNKLYIADPNFNQIVRMNQDGSQPERVWENDCDGCAPSGPQGPSFSSAVSGTPPIVNGDLYFNTTAGGDGVFKIAGAAASTNVFPGTFGPPTNIIVPSDCDECIEPGIGEGTGFDMNDNLLDVDQTNGVLIVPPPYTPTSTPAVLVNPASLSAPTAIALNAANGQLYISNTGTHQILVVGPGGVTSNYYTFTTSQTCSASETVGPDSPVFMQFDASGRLFVVTTTNTSVNGCGKVWRVDPPATPSSAAVATQLVDLNAAYIAEGTPLTSPQAIGLAMGPTTGQTQTVPLLPTGGSFAVGIPAGCVVTLVPPNNCISTISGAYPAGMFGLGDTLNVTFNEKTQQQYGASVLGTPYSMTTLAPVAGFNGDGIVPSLVCLNSSGNPCSDTVVPGASYDIYTTWQTTQTNYCSLMPHLLKGDPVGGPYTSLADTIINCTESPDPAAGTKGQSSCSSTSSSSCLSDWLNAFGPVTGSTAGITATATIASPTNGATYLVNQSAPVSFKCGQTPTGSSPSIVTSCTGTVTNPAYVDGSGNPIVLPVTSGGALPTSELGTNTLTVSANVDGGSAGTGATATYTVSACQDVSLGFNPSTVAVGTPTTVTVTLQSCNNKTEIGIVNITVTAPVGRSCGTKPLPTFSLPVLLGPKPQTFSLKLTIPSGFCAGTYTVTAQTYVGKTLVGTTSSALNVTAH